MASCFKSETPFMKFMKNGSMLLEELIASCDGKCSPLRNFFAKELKQATNNYDPRQRTYIDGGYLYKGFLEEREISVKKIDFRVDEESVRPEITDIVIGSQMSAHNNVLKLIGCCLETECPIVVYDFVGNHTLHDYMYDANVKCRRPLSWKCRIKIAMNIANAVAYLHTALSRPVVHRNIKPGTIMMDENNIPKLFDFSLSVSIPEDEDYVETNEINGSFGFLAPDIGMTGKVNEKSDVYSFGVVLFILLTGRTAIDMNDSCQSLVDFATTCMKENRIKEMVDSVIVAEGPWPGKDEQLEAFAALAFRCTQESPEDRPTMIEVGKELRQMYQSLTSPC